MGCVFSSPSTSESRRKKPSSSSDNNGRRRRRRTAEERAATDVGVRNGAAEKERRNVNIRLSHSAGADFPASSTPAGGIDRRKPRVEPCMLRNQQGWPAWLVEVAGDVIKDWTPRRANTFEKLSKVLKSAFFSLQNRAFNSRFQKKKKDHIFIVGFGLVFCSDWARDI